MRLNRRTSQLGSRTRVVSLRALPPNLRRAKKRDIGDPLRHEETSFACVTIARSRLKAARLTLPLPAPSKAQLVGWVQVMIGDIPHGCNLQVSVSLDEE